MILATFLKPFFFLFDYDRHHEPPPIVITQQKNFSIQNFTSLLFGLFNCFSASLVGKYEMNLRHFERRKNVFCVWAGNTEKALLRYQQLDSISPKRNLQHFTERKSISLNRRMLSSYALCCAWSVIFFIVFHHNNFSLFLTTISIMTNDLLEHECAHNFLSLGLTNLNSAACDS